MNSRSAANDESPPLDAREIAAAATSLAAHFQRLGMIYGPAATEAGIADWTARFATSESDEIARVAAARPEAASPKSPPPSTPPSTPQIAPPPSTPRSMLPQPTRSSSVGAVTAAAGPYPGATLPVIERESKLAELAAVVAACTRCDVLAKCRTQTVFGEGSATPRVAFFGEGPGADEDRTGRPFVGKAGQLLTKMIEACTFARADVYILNTVKCRPPGNRNPEPGEIQNCREYFVAQLELLRPEYIVCLGAISSQALLASTLSVGRLRGKFHNYHDSKVVVTYHPAYLLRNPDAKKAAWDDLQMMLRDMGITPRR